MTEATAFLVKWQTWISGYIKNTIKEPGWNLSLLRQFALTALILSAVLASQACRTSEHATVHAQPPLAELTLYDDALRNGFNVSAWHSPAPDPSYGGSVFAGSHALQKNLYISGGSGEFMAIHRSSGINTADYTHIDFYATSISPEGAKVRVRFAVRPWEGSSETVPIDIPSGKWTRFSIPIAEFGPNVLNKEFDGIAFSGGGPGAPSNDSDNNVAFDNIRLAKLTDNAPPQLLSAEALGQDTVNVTFSEKIASGGASNLSNFVLTSDTDPNYAAGRSPSAAVLSSDGVELRLTSDMKMLDGHTYTLTVSGVNDLMGNVITTGSQAGFTMSVSTVTLTVKADKVVYPFRDAMRGVATNNWNWLWHGLWDRSGSCCVPGKRDAIIEATKLLRPGVIRFAGGLWANRVGWDRTGASPEDGKWTFTDPDTGKTYEYTHKYTPQMVDAFADFAGRVGAKAIVQINVCDNNPKMWADMLRYTNLEKGYDFEYWELGNEQTLEPCGLTPTTYAKRYAEYTAVLKAVDPTIKMLGPVPHMPSYKHWEDALVNEVGSGLDVLTWHWYQLSEWTSNTDSFAYQGGSVEALLAYDGGVGTTCQEGFGCTASGPSGGKIAPDRLDRWTYRRGIAEAKLRQVNQYRQTNPDLEAAITEFGPHAVLHEHPINSNHLAALWLADVLPRHAYNGLDIVTYYSLEDGDTGAGNSRGLLGTWNNDFIDVRPIYYTQFMFSQYFGDMMVQSATSDPSQMVVVWASTDSKDPGTLKLMLVNFNGTAAEANLDISGFSPVAGTAYEMTSTSPLSLDNPRSFTQHQTTINGVKIPDVNISNPSTFRNAIASIQPKVISASSSFSYNIPAYSAVALVLRSDGSGTPNPAPPPDTTPPVRSSLQPSGTLAAGTSQATLSLITSENSTCRYSTTAGVSYGSMPITFAATGGTSHSASVSGLQDGGAYSYYVRCRDSSGNANGSDAKISFNVAAAPTPILPPSNQPWPAKVDLKVGESYTYTLMDGTQRTLTLLSYKRVIPRHKIEATVRVSGAGKTETHTLQVAFAGVPVAINGLRVFAYAWKEANEYYTPGFEEVGFTGDFPLTPGKDVGFALSDAKYTMYPDIDSYVYPWTIAFNQGDDIQTFLEPAGHGEYAERVWAHSGYDPGVSSQDTLLAITDGYVWNQSFGSEGAVWITKTNDQWFSPVAWLWTHVANSGALLPGLSAGDFVAKGTPLAHKGDHMGTKNSRDFGAWIFTAEIWNNQHKDDFPAPRYWLTLGPYSGGISNRHLAPTESGDLPDIQLRKGSADKDGLKKWKFGDNFANSVVRLNELFSVAPFSGYYVDHLPTNSVGYAATYIFSPNSRTAHLKWGAVHDADIWLNGKRVLSQRGGPLVIDQRDVILSLRPGWNTLIIKSSVTSGPWLFSPKIGDAKGNRIPELKFSTRDIDLKVSSVSEGHISINWSDPGYHGTFVETYRVDVATDSGFNNLVIKDLDVGRVTSRTLTGLNSGQEYYVRVKPYSYSEKGGSVYWHHVDSVRARTEGTEKVLPSTSPPGGLDPQEVPVFITIGSDDNNDSDGVNFLVNELLGGRVNPAGTGNPATYDGTPLRGTFYLIGVHETYSAGLCQAHRNAFLKGHEIGNHAYENKGGLTLSGWLESLSKTNAYISRTTGCEDQPRGVGVPKDKVYGFRAPEDNYNSDMYVALEQLGFTYSASTAVGRRAGEDGTNYPWPGTLDEGYPLASWQKDPGIHPGFWEVPQSVMRVPSSLGGGSVGYCDLDWFWEWRDDPDGGAAKIAAVLKHNLDLHLQGNRSPLHLCLHGDSWGKASWEAERSPKVLARQQALIEFIEYALTKPQVRVVRQIDVINWMRNPVPLGVSGDDTPPTAPTGLKATAVSNSQIDLSWTAAQDPESGVSEYNVYRDGVLLGSVNSTSYSDANLEEGRTYTYQVSAVNSFLMEGARSSPASAQTRADTTRPTISAVTSTGNPSVVTVAFSEPVEHASATNKDNYSIDNGVSVVSASLAADLKTVTLSTSTHSEGVQYTLAVSHVRDRARNPNTILSNSKATYFFTRDLAVSDLRTASGKDYQVVEDRLTDGAVVYIDRGYTFSSVPSSIAGSTYIRTANDDKASTGAQFLSFDVNQSVTVYVAYDVRGTSLPQWLSGWTDAGEILGTTDVNRRLYSKQFPKGTISLGGNLAAGASGADSNYNVVVMPGQARPPSVPINQAPEVSISSPADRAIFQAGDSITFNGSASDPEDGPLTGSALVWASSRDGQVGTGHSITTTLSAGDHTITLSATDHQGATATASVGITIQPPGTATLTVGSATGLPGASVEVPVTLDTRGTPVRSLRVNLAYQGAVLPQAAAEAGAGLPSGWDFSWHSPEPGDLRLIALAPDADGQPMDGVVFTAVFTIAAEAAESETPVVVALQEVRDSANAVLDVATIGGSVSVHATIYGDATGDSAFTTADINEIVDWLILRKPSPQVGTPRFTSADVNGDKSVDPADINLMVDRLLGRIGKFPSEP